MASVIFGEPEPLNLISLSPMTAVVVGEDHIVAYIEGDTLLEALGYAWLDEVVGHPVENFLPHRLRESHKKWFDSWINWPQERPLREAQPMTVQCKSPDLTIQCRISTRKFYLADGRRLGEQFAGVPFKGGIAFVLVI